MASKLFSLALAVSFFLLNCNSVLSQILPVFPCTTSLITTFAPCMNFISNNTSNGTSVRPSQSCCNSLKSMMSNGTECLCQILSNNILSQMVPINQNLAISLPSACNTTGVPLQCKASTPPAVAPAPNQAEGPTSNGGFLSPTPPPPTFLESPPPQQVPEATTPPPPPPGTTIGLSPAGNSGSRTGVFSSAATVAAPVHAMWPLSVTALLMVGTMALKAY